MHATWTTESYPPAMSRLDQRVRAQAIAKANRLLERGYAEERALPTAICRAMAWDDAGRPERASDVIEGPASYVYHDGFHWAVGRHGQTGKDEDPRFAGREEALRRAEQLARKHHSELFVFAPDGALMDRYTYFDDVEGSTAKGACHVSPHDEGWSVNQVGVTGAFKTFGTKAEAVAYGRRLAKAADAALVTHYQGGKLQNESRPTA